MTLDFSLRFIEFLKLQNQKLFLPISTHFRNKDKLSKERSEGEKKDQDIEEKDLWSKLIIQKLFLIL